MPQDSLTHAQLGIPDSTPPESALDPITAPIRLAQLDANLSMAERTTLASYYPEKIFYIAEVRVMMVQFKTSEGTMPVKIMMHDAAIRKLVDACQKQ